MNKPPKKQWSPKKDLKLLSVIHGLFLLGILILGSFIYMQGTTIVSGVSAKDGIFIYLVPLTAMFAYFGGEFVFNKMLSPIKREASLNQKFKVYLKASVLRMGLLEGASLVGIFAYSKHNNIFYLVITVALALYLLKIRPNKKKVVQDLSLNSEEERQFIANDKKA